MVMNTHISTVFEQRKRYIHHSNFKTPISGLSKNISQTQFSQEKKKKKNISTKETAAQLKLIQEWRSMRTKSATGVEPSRSNVDDEFLEAQPFVEEPVSFNFGDDYGNQPFVDLQRELENNWFFHGCRGINVVEGVKMTYTTDEIYILSPKADMINSFLRENLF